MPVQGTYYEAVCQSIDPVAKTVTAAFPESSERDSGSFTLSYDALVLGAYPMQLCHGSGSDVISWLRVRWRAAGQCSSLPAKHI